MNNGIVDQGQDQAVLVATGAAVKGLIDVDGIITEDKVQDQGRAVHTAITAQQVAEEVVDEEDLIAGTVKVVLVHTIQMVIDQLVATDQEEVGVVLDTALEGIEVVED